MLCENSQAQSETQKTRAIISSRVVRGLSTPRAVLNNRSRLSTGLPVLGTKVLGGIYRQAKDVEPPGSSVIPTIVGVSPQIGSSSSSHACTGNRIRVVADTSARASGFYDGSHNDSALESSEMSRLDYFRRMICKRVQREPLLGV